MRSVEMAEETTIISLCSFNFLAFITEMMCLLRGTDWGFKQNSALSWTLNGYRHLVNEIAQGCLF
jgi:hypothetical protein